MIDGAARAAGDGDMARAVRSPGGSKDAFWADITPYESGSDHWIYQEGGFAIPSIYLRDHPDVYIHTTGDVPDNIEPTKIKRSAFIAAASGYYLATMPDHGASLLRLSYANALRAAGRRRAARGGRGRGRTRRRGRQHRRPRACCASSGGCARSRVSWTSTALALGLGGGRSPGRRPRGGGEGDAGLDSGRAARIASGAASARRPTHAFPSRNPDVKGPLAPGGDWVTEKAGASAATIAITTVPNSDDVTYEIVNFIDGARTVARDPRRRQRRVRARRPQAVAEYLDVLAKAGAVTFRP